MEIWGGIESTINRVEDDYFDQLAYQNHYDRPADIDLIINLGIKKLRYPILWEKHCSKPNEPINWGVIGQNLDKLHKAGVEVIAGLVHHGSGPAFADIRDESFVNGLSDFAKAVATQFPWIKYYTPINEPLTTARFCGLYGLWYPHGKHTTQFLRILVQECKATIAAMCAIRTINPNAKLIQTEDLGKIHSTELLKYQAEFENDRKWLGIDLLCGKVNKDHKLWNFLIDNEITVKELQFFKCKPCVPAILGFNYYITSERFLDENRDVYPEYTHGGNGSHAYADVEAVRCSGIKIDGIKLLLKEAWERYGLPLAVTEIHLCCEREEQLRWVNEIWGAAKELQSENIQIEGLTIWALFGAYGWDKLLTEANGNYESGAFDLSSGYPRPTAVAKMLKELATLQTFMHPVLNSSGWWKSPSRIIYPPCTNVELFCDDNACPPVFVIGSTGTLGMAFTKRLTERRIKAIPLNRLQLNITDIQQIRELVEVYKPWAIINAAGFVDVDNAESKKEECFSSNTLGASNLAEICMSYGIKLVTFSTDLVFDGEKKAEYVESDGVNPLNIYGLSKANAEQQVMSLCNDALIIRTSAFFGPWDEYNFVAHIINGLAQKQQMKIADDVYISPTYVPDLVDMTLNLLIDDEKGIWHLCNQGTLTWYDLAVDVAARSKTSSRLIIPKPMGSLGLQAKRPSFSALKSNRGNIMPSLDNALHRLFNLHKIKSA
jgi:dTDP-4-dehydrorhamnose reductase